MLERFGDKACYTYNSAGIRTEKCIKNKATKYVVSGSTILSETTDGVSTIYYHSADGVIGFNRAGADYFYRKNIQGDIIAIVNASGTVVAKYVYDAWGNHKVYNSANTLIYDSQNPENAYANEIGYTNPFRYRSYYFDNETGLYYLQSRYYDPQVGRFINADSIDYLEPEELKGLNLYSYCQNNPVMCVDPTGHELILLLLSVIVGAVFGGVSAAISGQNIVAGVLVGAITGLFSGTVGLMANAMKGVAKIAFIFAGEFAIGSMSSLATTKFVENRNVRRVDEEKAISEGLESAFFAIVKLPYDDIIQKDLKGKARRIAQSVAESLKSVFQFFIEF